MVVADDEEEEKEEEVAVVLVVVDLEGIEQEVSDEEAAKEQSEEQQPMLSCLTRFLFLSRPFCSSSSFFRIADALHSKISSSLEKPCVCTTTNKKTERMRMIENCDGIIT